MNARIRQIRRASEAADEPGVRPIGDPEEDRLRALEGRIAQLEQLMQGLQGSVYREASRRAKRIAELESQLQPAVLGKALSKDARAREL